MSLPWHPCGLQYVETLQDQLADLAAIAKQRSVEALLPHLGGCSSGMLPSKSTWWLVQD